MPLSSSVAATVTALSRASPRALPAYSYGTSGFRGPAATLDSVNVRMGMLAAIRSWSACKQAREKAASGSASGSSSAASPAAGTGASGARPCPIIGVVVTASHNEEGDNGIKLVDPSGEMMAQEWESVATEIANADEEQLAATIDSVLQRFGLDQTAADAEAGGSSANFSGLHARVFVARDTRVSSPHLCALVVAGAKALGAQVVDYGVATTPQLHWLVREANSGREPTLDAYYAQMARAFRTALECRSSLGAPAGPHPAPPATSATPVTLPPLLVDCANGVGAFSVGEVAKRIAGQLHIDMRNTDNKGLNDQCGAEHVQKSRSLPRNFSLDSDRGRKLASVDGDADRLVYFYVSMETGEFRLLDGDKTIALYTLFLRDLLHAAGLAETLSLGIVQTAYANGASTIYMRRELAIDVQCANTGVKHLHHKAVQYDVGVYFESNGHGTVVFSDKAQRLIRAAAHDSQQTPARHTAARCLSSLLDLINQCVGDAVSDMLLVEVALYHRGWTLSDWDGVYDDLPSAMLKVKVADRAAITTTDAERRCVMPAGLQDAIDALVNAGPDGSAGVRRAFVRPSGTEDIVRVYAEAATREEVDKLANDVCAVVARIAGGV